MTDISIDGARLISRIQELGSLGRDGDGRLARLAASDADKLGRDLFVSWLRTAGLDVAVDRIGNIFGIWEPPGCEGKLPFMMGSHIDTVINAGIYDGCYGVLAALEVIEAMQDEGFAPSRPVVVAAFTNEEGVRFAPDMMGSLVCSGGMDTDTALATVGTDGALLGDELGRIGFAGPKEPGSLKPAAYVELHVEQGPVLEREGIDIGAVENLQGISWQKVTINGTANHAGTTPITMRSDAGYGAARVVTYLRERALASTSPMVATVGCIEFEPNAINVIPSRATLTIDLRHPVEDRLLEEERALSEFLGRLAADEGLSITTERLARSTPVVFDQRIVAVIEDAAKKRGLSYRRMTSGAGHDAQMMATIAPTAMIFVPSVDGISHNPAELTHDIDLIAGANLLLDVARILAKS
ncbi:Zn-dependent hydrolase [Sinorhizobium alkalisoli]|uniref:Zn-dependent hydrolase n=1 Tax=Sinorhizobium alkalisoli TaxID=1752398 RepID=A0A1E3VHM5_9HYPH|nr:Zn-dependent hydrolase [Sinorhizobium alkalisoli]ODR92366.1 Zn-dependent hydrolase [Sinorhizobium alkalisoli]QFI70724.1 Beta-ureidopropionase [Sinorhizobium alkalisoli]